MTTIEQLVVQASECFELESTENKSVVFPLEGLALRRSAGTTDIKNLGLTFFCVVLQGVQETTIGSRSVRVVAGESMIVSHSLPIESRFIEASADKPFVGIRISIDLVLLAGLSHEIDVNENEDSPASSLEYGPTDPDLIDVIARYLALAKQKTSVKVLGPLLLKEIHYRLLTAEQGTMLRKLSVDNSSASRISLSISHIRNNFRQPISMFELAKTAGMSTSSFYEHFKKITATTPLQYQKELRLIEAQQLLKNKSISVSSVAFEVGYESPTQFSREYSRKFGDSPSKGRE